jgi:Na+-translocating ferredoxin:NAD+ oxidoreductase RnfG subunit
MKMDFNLVRPWLRSLLQRHLRTSLALVAFLGVGGLLSTGPMQLRSASAQTTYFTARTVLAEFFPKSQNVGYQRFELTPDQRARLERRLGYAIKKPSYTFYVAKSGEVIDGYALIDEELGQHLPITFAVKFSPQGVVQRQEVMIYRERYGDEIRDPRFRQQFEGKTAADPLRASEEIIAVSGATISSRAMTVGVHRALVLLDELILSPQRPRSAQLAPSSARSLAAPTL